MNKELPKVSVVTITYGHEKYITETLDGVLMQQYDGPVEFIIANDNSPDATDEVVKKYFLENPAPSNFEIKYTKHETNKGMMPNFIWALEQATGEYIALCEGDDYWIAPNKLSDQIKFMLQHDSCSLNFTAAKTYNVKTKYHGEYYRHPKFINGVIEKRSFMSRGGGDFCTATVMFKKDLLPVLLKFLQLTDVGDFPLGLVAISQGDIGYLSMQTAMYRQNSENSWSNRQTFDYHKVLYDKGLIVLDHFDKMTNGEFKKITNFYRSEYCFYYHYNDIVFSKNRRAFNILLNNLSFNMGRNNMLIKTFLWKLLHSTKSVN